MALCMRFPVPTNSGGFQHTTHTTSKLINTLPQPSAINHKAMGSYSLSHVLPQSYPKENWLVVCAVCVYQVVCLVQSRPTAFVN